MKQFLPDTDALHLASPETKDNIKKKKQELQTLKRKLKTVPPSKKEELKTQIKTLVKELKVISPRATSW
jgi:hypothetical protein